LRVEPAMTLPIEKLVAFQFGFLLATFVLIIKCDMTDPKEQAKIIWESWITDSTIEEEYVYEEGEGEED
jgi:hypothetical protein